MILLSHSEVLSSRFTDVYRIFPNAKVDPNLQLYKRVGRQTGLKLDVMTRKSMLKELNIEADYLVYRKVHQIIDRNYALKMKIFDQKESVLTLFSSLYKQLKINVHFLPLEDRTFLEKARGALEKWLAVSDKAFKKEIVMDSSFGNLSVHIYTLLIDLISNL